MLFFSFRNKDAVSQMAVCPGHAVEPLPPTSENLQNKEVCSLWLFIWEDFTDTPFIQFIVIEPLEGYKK